jgi:hypothetical protein
MPNVIGRHYRSIPFTRSNRSPYLPHRITEANAQNRLPRVFENIHNLQSRRFQVKAPAVGEQMVFGVSVYDLCQPLPELAIQKPHDPANRLQRKSFMPEFADHSNFGEVVYGVEPTMAFVLGLDHSALVPPLQLASRNTRQSNYLTRCESIFHAKMFETIPVQNVSDILGTTACGSSKENTGISD